MHDTLQIQAQDRGYRGGFTTAWSRLTPVLQAADVTYANLEGPIAELVRCDGSVATSAPRISFGNSSCESGSVYTGYPLFNAHPSLALDLAASGVDVVSTANNHALDRFALGADRTLEALDRAGLRHAGTRSTTGAGSVHATTHVKTRGADITLAWVACTFSTNGIPDHEDQVLSCYDDEGDPNPYVLHAVRTFAEDPDVDGVIVTPHWGIEYRTRPSQQQQTLAQALVEAGALAVVGSHPHVLQPLERIVSGEREALVMYSLGNFVADQPELPMRTAVVLLLRLAKHYGRTKVESVRFVPFAMTPWPDAVHGTHTLVPIDVRAPHDELSSAVRAVVGQVLPLSRALTVDAPWITDIAGCADAGQGNGKVPSSMDGAARR
jgi:poly-gamma-glutamate synthesis protein (capsule biosynthesis protein)